MLPELHPEVTGKVAGMTNTQTIYDELFDQGVVVYGPSRPYPILTAYFVFRRQRPPTALDCASVLSAERKSGVIATL
jgi:hypothetical protein